MADALVPLYSTTLATDTASVSIAGIPTSGYRDLRLVVTTRSTYTANQFDNLYLRFNSDSGSNYNWVLMGGDSNNAANSSSGTNVTYSDVGHIMTSSSSNTSPSIVTVDIFDFGQSDKQKSIVSRSNAWNANVTANAGRWASTAAISSITITGMRATNFVAGSTFSIFGIVS